MRDSCCTLDYYLVCHKNHKIVRISMCKTAFQLGNFHPLDWLLESHTWEDMNPGTASISTSGAEELPPDSQLPKRPRSINQMEQPSSPILLVCLWAPPFFLRSTSRDRDTL
jgi:hypothetical protein